MDKQCLKQMEEEKLCSLASCTKPRNQRCTKCMTVSYCSKTCQEKDWKEGLGTRCKEITWESDKKEYDLREAEEEQQREDLEGELLRREEEERGRKRQLTSPRTGLPAPHRSRTGGSGKSRKTSHRRTSRSRSRDVKGGGRRTDSRGEGSR